MQISFHHILPECIDYLPFVAVRYLEEAIRRTPHNVVPLEIVLLRAKAGHGQLYLVESDKEIVGTIYLLIFNTEDGRILNLNYVGAKPHSLHRWKDDLRQFIRECMTLNRCAEFVIAGRHGWIKLFPELAWTGSIYSARILH